MSFSAELNLKDLIWRVPTFLRIIIEMQYWKKNSDYLNENSGCADCEQDVNSHKMSPFRSAAHPPLQHISYSFISQNECVMIISC